MIIRDPLAPVVTVEENYLVGGNETPTGFPGMAHAQEHMAFRGCAGVNADQTAAIYAQLGGAGNADTQQNITQYFETVPASDLDIALRLDAACMQDVEDSQSEWANEKGAIEQEVARDLSNPTYKFITRLNEDMFSGTVYSHDALGTHDSFEATTGAMLKDFYKKWYAPNNAILVITGNVDPAAVLATVKELYGKIERKTLPLRPEITLPPVKSESFTLDSNLPYLLAFVSYRAAGTESPDFPAVQILSDVLGSQRGNLYALVPLGKALETGFGIAETFPKASVIYSAAVLPAEGNAAPVIAEMRKIMSDYAANGVPAELVEAAKRKELARVEFRRNSIPGLAEAWSEALAAEGRKSPDDDVDAMKRVTTEDVNRVAKKYLVDQESITAILKPQPTGGPVSAQGFGGGEQLTAAPKKPVDLPPWASSKLLSLEKPRPEPLPSDVTLPNGLRLIVRTEKITPTITIQGDVRNNPQMQVETGKDGVNDVLDEMFSYGTKSLDRLAFQKALDDIAAEESAGFEFSLEVLKPDFSRGVQLLADNELNPALPDEAFQVIKPQTAQYFAGRMKSPGQARVASLRKQSPRQVLPPHRPRPKGPQGRNPTMGPPTRRHHQYPRSLRPTARVHRNRMPTLHNLIAGIKTLLQRQQQSHDLDEELRAFQEASIEEKVRSGVTPQEAQRAARIEMGSIETVKEKSARAPGNPPPKASFTTSVTAFA